MWNGLRNWCQEGEDEVYEAKDLLVYKDGCYQRQDCFSERAVREIERELSEEEGQYFREQIKEWKRHEK